MKAKSIKGKMEISKNVEIEVMRVHNLFWDSYAKRDIDLRFSLCSEDITFIGSGLHERAKNRTEYKKINQEGVKQFPNPFQIEFLWTNITMLNENVACVESEVVWSQLINDEMSKELLRNTTLLKRDDNKWLVTHVHGSVPDYRLKHGDYMTNERTIIRNRELERQVFERTQDLNKTLEELELTNRDLEIEASLERVRAVAMSMHKSDDLLSICEVSFKEFKKLGFDNIRNAVIHILNDEKVFFLDYDYSDYLGGSINSINYNSHPVVENYLEQIKISDDAFAEVVIEGQQLDSWKDFQRSSGQLDDPTLDGIPALYYYLYSIGVGDIGISTFSPINESQVGILKRFRNVFDLAYRRYTDITKAEAQAREAKIEASLEKVRASAMSMHKSDDLLDVCEILYKGLNQLDFDEMRNTMINIHNDEKETFINYDYSDAIGRSINHLTYNIHPVIEKQIKQIRSTNDAFSETSFTGKDLEEWKKFRNKIGEKDDPRIDNISALYYYFYSIGTGSIGISTFSSINEEKLELLKRFRNVFSLSYQRYLDIALAEAQAREAEIQLALERVRARSLAMHHTSELQDMVNILAQQLYNMNLDINGGVFIVINAELDKDISLWASGGAADYVQKVTVPFLNSPIFIDLRDAIKRKNNFFTEERTDKEKIRLFKHLFKYQPWNSLSQKRKEELLSRKGGYSRSVAISQYTSISITNHNGKKFSNDENEILKRFGNVFEQSYTRFLDLQKAEAQAKEAKIEASLERVRAVAMSMLKSDELLKVCESVFNELRLLGFSETDLRNTQIVINNDEKQIYNGYQYSDYTGGEIAEVPYDMHPIIRMLNDKLKKSTDAFADIEISGKAMDDWKAFVKSFPQKPDEKLYNASELHYYFYSVGIGALGISSFKSLQEEQLQILQRLRNVFNLSYQRYSDIALAEAQAREAQIELALERVRARTMAMHNSEELSETAHVLFQQFKEIDKEPKMLTIGIMNENEELIEFWVTDWSGGGSKVDRKFNASIDEPILLNKIYKAWKKKQKSIVIELSNEELLGWVKFRISLSGIPDSTDYSNSRGFVAAAFFSKGILSISTYEPHSPETVQLLEKFAGVFNLTYTRFLDLQKAEAQAREAQIETSIEKIRSRSLAMQKPKELVEVAELLRKEMGHLGVEELETSSIYIVDKENQQAECWYAIKDIREENKRLVSDEMTIILIDTWVGNEMWKFYQSKKEQTSIVMKGNNRKEWINYCADKSQELQGYYGDEIPERTYHLVKFNGGYMGAASPGNISAESWDLLRRAASVFSLAYTRFKDLQDAEASAREAQIEAALERVRSRSMGMQKSEELKEVIRVVYEQFVHLKINVDHAGFVVDYTPKGDWTFWIADERDIPSKITHPYFESVWANQFNEAKEKGADFFATNLNFEEKNKFYNELLSYVSGLPEASKDFYLSCLGLAATTVLFDNVSLYIENFSGTSYSDEENKILMRFGKVFQQTYTRFLDLQKAEAQARENQIQLALERARAQSMMMQHSKELDDTLRVFHEQVLQLGIPSAFSYLWLPDEEKERHIFWAAWAENNSTVFKSKAINYPMDRNEPATAQCIIDWKGKEPVVSYHVPPAGVKSYFAAWQELIDGVEQLKPEYFFSGLYYVEAFMKYGCFGVMIKSELSEEEKKILYRFTIEFERAYTRFLDLQKAETQAREAQIEAALEKVRTVALSLKKSDEMLDIAQVLYEQLIELGFSNIRNAIIDIHNDNNETFLDYDYSHDMGRTVTLMSYQDDPIIEKQVRQIESSSDAFFELILEGQELQDLIDMRLRNGENEDPRLRQIEQLTYNLYSFGNGAIGISNFGLLSDEQKIVLKRFRNVFAFAYKRYTDMVIAETQAREVKKQASLDRIRAEIASMRTSEDLNHITPIIWRELKNLEVPFIRCGVFIVDEDKEYVHVYLTTPDGKSLAALNLSFDANELTSNTVYHWRNKQVFKEHWTKKEFINWTKSMIELGQVEKSETYQGSSTPPETLDLHFIPFAQGMLYVGDVSPLTDDKLSLVKTLAEAFSIAYSRYEDFKNLEDAKNRVEVTLTELKSAQAQLVQAEKLASLGQLTAGIAHEIKNPLNFVNNFSEISSELLEEMKIELQNDNKDEAIAIAEDIKHNLEKINQHGKRADSIVKGMLLHSRGSAGEKSLTNLNDLLDQYVNLAYHGLRAQDKEFNITIQKEFDETLEKINVVPQDISRVFLNIVNNGFYAANEKKKKSENDFAPILKVSTKNLPGKVEIRIRDNGNGIPQSIKNNIFNPFFTTKPAGEGTGLGLSLSYDIITKVHNGEIIFDTKENEFTECIITIPCT